MSISLSGYTEVFRDDFDQGLNKYSEGGIWNVRPKWDALATNSPYSVFLSDWVTTAAGTPIGIDPFETGDGTLRIGSGAIPDDKMALVKDALVAAGQQENSDSTAYYTGMISTNQSWAQTYGYFEIEARVPAGKGHWSAFWLAPAGLGWPPEIDIFEIYGKSLTDGETYRDNQVNTGVFFDAVDTDGQSSQDVGITNPYHTDENGYPQNPIVKKNSGGEQYVFAEETDVADNWKANIYDDTYTYATKWTPDEIIFYFGASREGLVEIYRAPTPEDVNTPMYIIANDQIGSEWGWNPAAGLDHLTFAENNGLEIDSISVWTLDPARVLIGGEVGAILIDDARDSRILATAGDDRITTGGGADMVALNGGEDIVYVDRGQGNTIVEGFGPDDRIIFDGFYFEDAASLLRDAAQMGGDVWLMNGAAPGDPQTVLLRDVALTDLTAEQFVVRWSVTKDVWSSRLRDGSRVEDLDGDGIVSADAGGSRLSDGLSTHGDFVTMIGGAGGDAYFVYRRGTVIDESGGGGIDTAYVSRSFVLSNGVENMVMLHGGGGVELTGNGLGNRITGTSGDETFRGGGGEDLLDLGAGRDEVVFAAGDSHDVVVGFEVDDSLRLEGFDLSQTELESRTVTVGADLFLDLGTDHSITLRGAGNLAFDFDAVEIVRGSVAIDGVADISTHRPVAEAAWMIQGDDDRAAFQGQDGSDRMAGGSVSDILLGRDGDDILYGGAGSDTLRGWNGEDRLHGGSGSDLLDGNAGDDVLEGGAGADRLFGGSGADRFVFHHDDASDLVMDFEQGDRLDVSSWAGGVLTAEDLWMKTGSRWITVMRQDDDGADQTVFQVRDTTEEDIWEAFIF